MGIPESIRREIGTVGFKDPIRKLSLKTDGNQFSESASR
jgi:hypothetical protein